MSDVFRKLSTVFLISSAAFSKAKPTDQTAALTQSDGLPVLFVDNFAALTNKKAIRDNLLAGKDVSMELEFNGIELTEEDRRVLSLVGPILEKIVGIAAKYPWLNETVSSAERLKRYGNSGLRNTAGYTLGLKGAEAVWKHASAKWGGVEVGSMAVNTGSWGRNSVTVTDNAVAIGCQTLTRRAVEAIAQEMGWEPNVG